MAKKFLNYTLDGKDLPGVTTILGVLEKSGLNFWYGKLGWQEANRQKNEAADFGHSVHGAIEDTCNSKIVSYENDRVKLSVENFHKWAELKVDKFIEFESPVFHETLYYAGTVDIFALMKDGRYAILDIKTSKKVRAENHLQVCAYANCTKSDTIDLTKFNTAFIVHLDHKTLEWNDYEIEITPELFDVFKACLKIYNWRNNNVA